MKILLLSDEFPPDGVGGDAAVVASLAREYAKNGHAVFIVAAALTRDSAGRDTWEGLPIERVYAHYHPRWQAWLSLWNPSAVSLVRKVLAEFSPDVVHAHGLNRYLSYRTIADSHKSGAKVFLTAHDAMLYHYSKARDESKIHALRQIKDFKLAYNPFRNLVIRHYLRYISGVIAVSESLSRALRANGIKVHSVIHNGIHVEEWNVDVTKIEDFKKEHTLGDRVVLFGGRLSGAKGAFVIIDAMAKVIRGSPDAQLCVIGTMNKTAERMMEMAREQGIERNIIFTGRISGERLKAAYHAAALVVVPSLNVDPFPTVNLEAAASGKPVVATCFGGSQEAVKDGQTGFIVEPSDSADFAEKIALLLADTELRARLGTAGRELMQREFTLEKQTKQYLELFEKKN